MIFSIIEFTGPEATQFLHAQLTADIQQLNDHDACAAAYLTVKGRVLASLIVTRIRQDHYLVLISPDLAESISQLLNRFVFRTKVSITLSDQWQVVPVMGDSSACSLEKLALTNLGDSYQLQFPGPMDLQLTQQPAVTEPELIKAWKKASIQQGIVWVDADLSGTHTPQMLAYDRLGFINFKKGCYPGQEIVARTRYLGKVKRTIYLITGRAGLAAGDSLQTHSKEHQGTLLQAVGDQQQSFGLALLPVSGAENDWFDELENQPVTINPVVDHQPSD